MPARTCISPAPLRSAAHKKAARARPSGWLLASRAMAMESNPYPEMKAAGRLWFSAQHFAMPARPARAPLKHHGQHEILRHAHAGIARLRRDWRPRSGSQSPAVVFHSSQYTTKTAANGDQQAGMQAIAREELGQLGRGLDVRRPWRLADVGIAQWVSSPGSPPVLHGDVVHHDRVDDLVGAEPGLEVAGNGAPQRSAQGAGQDCQRQVNIDRAGPSRNNPRPRRTAPPCRTGLRRRC